MGVKEFGLGLLGLGGFCTLGSALIGVGGNLVRHESVVRNAAKAIGAVQTISEDRGKRQDAFDSLTGALDSASKTFGFGKWKYVSDKGSGPIGYLAPGWYSEVYRVDTNVYIGNRKYNKPRGINFSLDATDVMGFEVGDFKNGAVKQGGYAGYSADDFCLFLGNVKKYKLDGWVLMYDEYNNDVKMTYYKKGETKYGLELSDEEINYVDLATNDVLAEYNFDTSEFVETKKSGWFSSNLPKDDMQLKFEDGVYYVSLEDQSWEYDSYDGKVNYDNGAGFQFDGNAYAFSCTCEYNKKGETITYDFQTLKGVKISQSDGTVGEVISTSENEATNNFMDQLSTLFSEVGSNAGRYAVGELVSLTVDSVPYIGTIDLLTGGKISDTITDGVMDGLESNDDSVSSVTDKLMNSAGDLFDAILHPSR